MANEGITHAVLELAGKNIRALSVDWGPWDGGMVTPELKKSFAARGLTAIPLDLGAAAFADELERGSDVEVVLEGPRPNEGIVHREFGLARDPWLADHLLPGRRHPA